MPSRTAGSVPQRIARRLSAARLRRDESGSLAVEFAIIAPIFFFLMFVIAETALVFIAEQVMDNAIFETARLIRTGQVQNSGLTKEEFKTEVCNRMSIFVDCDTSDFYLDVSSYASFEDMNDGEGTEMTMVPVDEEGEFTTAGDFDFGEESEIVVMRAYYKWQTRNIISPILDGPRSLETEGMSGKRLIGSFAAFRNEPFGQIEAAPE